MVNRPCLQPLEPAARTAKQSIPIDIPISSPRTAPHCQRPYADTAATLLSTRRSCAAIACEMLPAVALISIVYVSAHALLQLVYQPFEPFLLSLMATLKVGRFVVLLEGLRRYFDDRYLVQGTMVKRQMGFLSYNYRVIFIQCIDIREIRIDQTVAGRFFNFGHIKIGTASTGDYEVILEDVPDPAVVAAQIQKYRARLLKKLKDGSNYSDQE